MRPLELLRRPASGKPSALSGAKSSTQASSPVKRLPVTRTLERAFHTGRGDLQAFIRHILDCEEMRELITHALAVFERNTAVAFDVDRDANKTALQTLDVYQLVAETFDRLLHKGAERPDEFIDKTFENRDLGGIGADTPTAVASKLKNGPNAHFPPVGFQNAPSKHFSVRIVHHRNRRRRCCAVKSFDHCRRQNATSQGIMRAHALRSVRRLSLPEVF